MGGKFKCTIKGRALDRLIANGFVARADEYFPYNIPTTAKTEILLAQLCVG